MNKKQIYINYDRKNKWKGLIDYKSLIIFIIYFLVIYNLTKLLPIKLEYIIYTNMFLNIPILALLCSFSDNDSAIDMIFTIIKYLFKRKIYVNEYDNIKKLVKVKKV